MIYKFSSHLLPKNEKRRLMNYSEIVHDIVAQVLEQIDTQANLPGVAGQENTYGLFKCVNDAVKAAESAQKQCFWPQMFCLPH